MLKVCEYFFNLLNDALLLDHRYAICTKHGLPFKTVNGKFATEKHVLRFIHKNQLNRRNLNGFEKASHVIQIKKLDLSIKAEERMQSGVKDDNPHQHAGEGCGDSKDEWTDRQLAEEAGISHNTVSQVSKILDHASEDTKQKLKEGKLSVRKAYKDIKREEVSQESNFPKGQYRIIHADPYLRDNTLPCGWNMKSLQFNPGNLPVKENLDPDQSFVVEF